MKFKWRIALGGFAALVLMLLLASCAADGFVVTGEVIDSETGKPVPDVWVHQEWVLDIENPITLGWARPGPQGCRAEQVTRSDANGKFRFEAPGKLRTPEQLGYSAKAYLSPLVPGYEQDGHRSKYAGEAKQIVALNRLALSRVALGDQSLALMRTWRRCEGRTSHNVSATDSAAIRPEQKITQIEPAFAPVPTFVAPDDARIPEAAKAFHSLGLSVEDVIAAVARSVREPNPAYRENVIRREIRRSHVISFYRDFVNKAEGKK